MNSNFFRRERGVAGRSPSTMTAKRRAAANRAAKALAIAAAFLFAMPLFVVTAAQAQSYPDRTVRILSGLMVGTSGDIAGRMLTDRLAAQMDGTFVFENRPGANGQIAARALKSSQPDGTNLLLTASSTMVTAPLTNVSPGYDVFTDFTPITQAVAAPLFLVVNAALGVSTTAELIAYAKAHPNTLNYGSVGRGSIFHFQGEATNIAAGIDMVHVPYASASMSNIVADLVSNRLQVFFPAYPAVPSMLATGKVKLLGVFAEQRFALLPDLPTVKESIPELGTVPSWFGLFGPTGLNASIVARLETEVGVALRDAEIIRKLNQGGMIPLGNSAADMTRQLARQSEDMKQLAERIGIRPE